ncbi:hypothetical protein B7R21_04800 [Subtercola boreus]|uniref:Uncharacterized protein n=1 Tax=Subtercola boreus TaxID=120213 RepID=A0A3E0W2M9_9MICO|nr:hypothetical protein B7R21_04800 [Subtercola boreus]
MPGYVVVYNRKSCDWSVEEFAGPEGHRAALLRRFELERDRTDPDVKKTHSRYVDGRELARL